MYWHVGVNPAFIDPLDSLKGLQGQVQKGDPEDAFLKLFFFLTRTASKGSAEHRYGKGEISLKDYSEFKRWDIMDKKRDLLS